MAGEDGYYSEDLDLLEEHDLLDSDREREDERSHASDSEEAEIELQDSDRLDQIKTIVLGICSALGGYEQVSAPEGRVRSVYQLGDDCLGCLRDLRKLWRKDDSDPSRSIARVFAQVNVLHNDLVPILLQTAGKGGQKDKIALACTDLLTALTWPIDAAAEIHDAVTKDYDLEMMQGLPELERAQVQYKSSILRLRAQNASQDRDALSVILRYVLLPSLSKPRVNRAEKDVGIISMCMHFFRNLLAIRDPVATSLSSSDTLANASLQSNLIATMQKHHILDTLAMLASNSEAADFNPWNAVTVECIYHIFVGTKVKAVANLEPPNMAISDTSKENRDPQHMSMLVSSSALASSLTAEAKLKRASTQANSNTRHSRFGTTINYVGPDGQRRIARTQASLKKSVAQLTDEAILKGRRKFRRRKAAYERGAPRHKAEWTPKAARILQAWADNFLQTGFETLSKSVLKDIRSEKEKMGDLETARIRVMQLGAYFLDYFLLRRANSHALRASTKAADKSLNSLSGPNQTKFTSEATVTETIEEWPFALVAEWLEPWAFRMVLVRSIQAQESKSWLEFVSSVQLWTVLLRLVDQLSYSKMEKEREVADGLQAQLYYLSETLEACHAIVRSYSTQSFACLDAVVTFAHVMPKMLERYSANRDHMYVKAKKHVRKSRQDGTLDEHGDESAQIKEQAKDTMTEREFKFNDFQRKLATRQLTKACIVYLLRWREFTEVDDQLTRLVSVMHRIAVKANNYPQFFGGVDRAAFRQIMCSDAITRLEAEAKGPTNDLKKIMDYVMRKFSKLTPEQQALYDVGKRPPRSTKEPHVPAEIKVRPGRSLEEQIGIAVGLLLEKEKMGAVLWIKSALEMASTLRTELVLHHEEQERRERDSDEDILLGDLARQNESVVEQFQQYDVGYNGNDELRIEASTAPQVKLLCRLAGMEADERESLHWRWYVPKEILPIHLDERISFIEQYIREPFDAQGLELAKLVQRIQKGRQSYTETDGLDRAVLPGGLGDNSESEDDGDYFDRPRPATAVVSLNADATKKGKLRKAPGGAPMHRGPRKQKTWTQNDFIEDSDDEFEFAMAEAGADTEDIEPRRLLISDDESDDDILADDSSFLRAAPKSRRSTFADKNIDDDEQSTPPTSSDVEISSTGSKQRANSRAESPAPIARRPDPKRLFLSTSDDESDVALSQESIPASISAAAQAQSTGSKRRRLVIADDDDDE